MKWHKTIFHIETSRQGLYDITDRLQAQLEHWQVQEGICHLFLQHTSASLLINENYDPSAGKDIEAFLARLAPEGQVWHQHTLEGPDDSPSHFRAMLTNTSLSIPVEEGKLCLGTWQGVFLAEHRRAPHRRKLLLRCLSVDDELRLA